MIIHPQIEEWQLMHPIPPASSEHVTGRPQHLHLMQTIEIALNIYIYLYTILLCIELETSRRLEWPRVSFCIFI